LGCRRVARFAEEATFGVCHGQLLTVIGRLTRWVGWRSTGNSRMGHRLLGGDVCNAENHDAAQDQNRSERMTSLSMHQGSSWFTRRLRGRHANITQWEHELMRGVSVIIFIFSLF